MWTRSLKILSALAAVLTIPQAALEAQTTYPDSVHFIRRNLGGPRMGVTFVTGDLADSLNNRDMGQLLSQFGWHFEYQVIPEGGGPQFVIQFVPLLAGVEYGKLIPSATLVMGIRFPRGWEFGLGPNALLVGGTDIQGVDDIGDAVETALVMGLGKSFDYGGVSIPLNVVYARNPRGNRFSLIFGYAIQRRVQRPR
ncbi:MAG: hypothetical protein ACE5PT_02740 [Gemmatimonadales bacterium]